MRSSIQDLGKLKRSIDFEIPLEEIKSTYDHVIRRLRNVKLNGFRPGKFPKGWIEKNFKEYMMAEALENIIPKYYAEALKRAELQAVTSPSLEDVTFDLGQPMSFKVSFEVRPEFPELPYDQFKLQAQEINITPEEVEMYIAQLRDVRKTLEAKPEGSVVEAEDVLIADYEYALDGSWGTDQKAQGDRIEMKKTLPEFASNLLGMQAGETKEFSFIANKQYGEQWDGKTATFRLTVKSIEKEILPALEMPFFEHFEGVTNELEFRQFVNKRIEENKDRQRRTSYRDQIKSQVLSFCGEFDVPEKLIEEQQKQMADQERQQNPNITEEELKASQEKNLENIKSQLRLSFILDRLIQKESEAIKPNQNEAFERFSWLAFSLGQNPQHLIGTDQGKTILRNIMHQVTDEAALDFLAEKALNTPQIVIASH